MEKEHKKVGVEGALKITTACVGLLGGLGNLFLIGYNIFKTVKKDIKKNKTSKSKKAKTSKEVK